MLLTEAHNEDENLRDASLSSIPTRDEPGKLTADKAANRNLEPTA